MEQNKLEIIRNDALIQAARILRARDQTPFNVQKFTLDLSAERSESNPFVIGFPFKTMWLKNGSTNATSVNVKFNKNDANIQLVELNSNDIVRSDEMFAQAFLSWSAQSGESIEIYVFVSAEIQTGALINSGTVSVAPASVISVPISRTADDTGNIFIPANSGAKYMMMENLSAANDVKFGGAGLTNSGAATDGITLRTESSLKLDCTADVYLRCAAGLTAQVQIVYFS